MERQNEPLAQQKPWEEMTEEERQVIRESWKHTLPEEYDVFCIGVMDVESDLNIPGNLYACGFLKVSYLVVGGAAIFAGYVDTADITVQGGPCICSGSVNALNVSVSNGDFISDGSIDVADITVQNGDCIVHHKIDSCAINVNNGTLDCYDVDSNRCKIHATDYVCRYYEEEI